MLCSAVTPLSPPEMLQGMSWSYSRSFLLEFKGLAIKKEIENVPKSGFSDFIAVTLANRYKFGYSWNKHSWKHFLPSWGRNFGIPKNMAMNNLKFLRVTSAQALSCVTSGGSSTFETAGIRRGDWWGCALALSPSQWGEGIWSAATDREKRDVRAACGFP